MSTWGVGASGFVGIALETTSGTYAAPTEFLLLRNESLHYEEARVMRRPLRGVADITGLLGGNVQVTGDIQVEVIEDQLVTILQAARGVVTKTGSSAPYTYTFKPTQSAVPGHTLSIACVRNGQVFGYTGCIVSSMTFTTDGGLLVATFSILGRDEASQTLPTPTYITTDPYHTGMYAIEVPTATQVFDTDQFQLAINDNGESQYRLKGAEAGTPGSAGTRGAQFVKYGERAVELTLDRDFMNRTEYDAYKALTAQSITVRVKRDANNSIDFVFPKSIADEYPITGLTGQAELIRANVKYNAIYDTTATEAYHIAIKSSTSITLAP